MKNFSKVLSFFDFSGRNESVLSKLQISADDIPFPKNESFSVQIFVSSYLSITTIVGAILSCQILSYLRTLDRKARPINTLIWFDQVNNLVMGLSNVFLLLLLNFSIPMRDVFGDRFCYWAKVPSSTFLSGSAIWSCMIAVYRLLYITSSTRMNRPLNESLVLTVMIVFGLLLQGVATFVISTIDERGVMTKLCKHVSNSHLEIILSLKKPVSALDEIYLNWKLEIVIVLALNGVIVNLIEFSSYIFIFYKMYKHDNLEAILILKPSVIKQRNQTNAVTMTGQVICFFIKIWFSIIVGLLAVPFNAFVMREWAGIIKSVDFALIPLVMILTSAPLRTFLAEKVKWSKYKWSQN